MSKKDKEEQPNAHPEATTTEVIGSRVFAMAMGVAETYASSKKKVFRVLQHAFEKLREESDRNRLKDELNQQVSVLVRMVRAYYSGLYKKVPTSSLLKIIGGLVYFVWILDFIPDFIPILGLADDIAVIVWVYNGIKEELEDFERWESVSSINIDND